MGHNLIGLHVFEGCLTLLDVSADQAASPFGWHSFVKKNNVVQNDSARTHFMRQVTHYLNHQYGIC
jgi:hypothetical protein